MKQPLLTGGLAIFSVLLVSSVRALASSGTEGASFLELPVGARPVGLGSAYTALATDAYAPTWNPAGLGFLPSTQFAGMHQIYAENTSFEYASFVHPLSPGRSVGAAIQYFLPGSITGRDATGNTIGDIEGSYAAYSLAYGQQVFENLSLGVAGKWIYATIDGVSASAWGGDAGLLYQLMPRLRVAGTLDNVGTKLTFLQSGDPLPLSEHLGVAYNPRKELTLAAEAVAQKSGPFSGHFGAEWTNAEGFSARAGYDTERTQQLTALAGFSVGVGLNLWGQDLSYTFVPLGDFGTSQYLSLVLRFGAPARAREDEESLMHEEDMDSGPSLMNEMMGTEDDKDMNASRDLQ